MALIITIFYRDERMLPEFQDDETLKRIIEMFDARVEYAHNPNQVIGSMSMKVRTGEDDWLEMQPVRLVTATSKANLERARAVQFAEYLLGQGRQTARGIWQQAAQWESEMFMEWVKTDVAQLRQNRGIA